MRLGRHAEEAFSRMPINLMRWLHVAQVKSQLYLIGMSQRLVFTTTSLHNVVISNASDVLYYEVITPKWERQLTKISRLDPVARQFHPIAELQNFDDKPVMIDMYNTLFRPVEEFLQRNDGPILSGISYRSRSGELGLTCVS